MPKFIWPNSLMPNLLAIRQSRNLFNFGQYKLFIDYIFHVLHTEVVFKVPVAEKGREVVIQLCLCFSSNHSGPDSDCPE